MTDRSSYLTFLIAAFLSSTFIYCINLWFSVSGFYLVLSTIFLLLTIVFAKERLFIAQKIDFRSIFLIILFVFSILSFTLNVEDINGFLSLAMWVNRFAMFLAPLTILLYFAEKVNQPFLSFLQKNKYAFLIVISLVIQLTLIRIAKVPDIDVYRVLKYGPLRALSFQNPYQTGAVNSLFISKDFGYRYFAYGPATIILFLPFDVLLREPRYLLVLANFLAAFSLYKISMKNWRDEKTAEVISLIYLFNPRLVSFLTFSLTDSLIIALLFCGILFFLNRKLVTSGILLSLTLSIKVFYGLPFLFLLKDKAFFSRKLILAGALTFALLHLPFALLDWQAIYKSIVTLNVGSEVFGQLGKYSLTFATFVDRQFRYYPPQFIFPIIEILVIIIYWITISRNLTLTKTLAAVSLVFITTIFLGPIANSNYYFTGSQILLLAISTFDVKNLKHG